MVTNEMISKLRFGVFGLTGLTCILYGALAIMAGQPDPVPFWIPGALGLMAAIVLTGTSAAAGQRQANMAWDESYRSDVRRAASIAFWIGVVLNPIFTVLIMREQVSAGVGLAAMGTWPPGAYLLLIVWFDQRGRG